MRIKRDLKLTTLVDVFKYDFWTGAQYPPSPQNMSNEADRRGYTHARFEAVGQLLEINALAEELEVTPDELVRIYIKTAMLSRSTHFQEDEQLLRVDNDGRKESAYEFLLDEIRRNKKEASDITATIPAKSRLGFYNEYISGYIKGFAEDIEVDMETFFRGVLSFGNKIVRDEINETGYLLLKKDGESDARIRVIPQK